MKKLIYKLLGIKAIITSRNVKKIVKMRNRVNSHYSNITVTVDNETLYHLTISGYPHVVRDTMSKAMKELEIITSKPNEQNI